MRARHRLSKFLLRRELEFAGPGGSWGVAHWRWLRGLAFADHPSRSVFNDYVAAVVALEQRRSGLDAQLELAAPRSPMGADDRQSQMSARGQHRDCVRGVL